MVSTVPRNRRPRRGRAAPVALPWLLGLVVVCAGPAAGREALGQPPSRGRAEELFGRPPRAILAYKVWDGVPHILFQIEPGGRLHCDYLRLDWVSIEWPPRPAWQWTGVWSMAAPTAAPASLHVARCTGIHGEECDKETELFGQINAPEIATLVVLVEGRWRRYPVAAPGYAVRLDGVRGAPTDDRWLDAAGQIVLTAREAPPGPVRP